MNPPWKLNRKGRKKLSDDERERREAVKEAKSQRKRESNKRR